MRWSEWKFSARLALQDSFIRWTAVVMFVVIFGMSAFFLWKLLPEVWRSGVITFHYNVYLGIDDVRPWAWVFMLPGAALGFALVDSLFALSLFRHHPLASRTVMALGMLSTIVWAVGTFFLMLINL